MQKLKDEKEKQSLSVEQEVQGRFWSKEAKTREKDEGKRDSC